MDEEQVVGEYGGQITFWPGFDVQQTIPFGTPEDIRRKVRHIFDTFHRADGRFIFTLGNGITGDTVSAHIKIPNNAQIKIPTLVKSLLSGTMVWSTRVQEGVTHANCGETCHD